MLALNAQPDSTQTRSVSLQNVKHANAIHLHRALVLLVAVIVQLENLATMALLVTCVQQEKKILSVTNVKSAKKEDIRKQHY